LQGLSFTLGQKIERGLPVEILMTLPHDFTLAGPMKIRCVGYIRRSEESGAGRIAVVAQIERHEVLDSSDNPE
jgi:hypothetical protein